MPGGVHSLPPGLTTDLYSEHPTSVHINISAFVVLPKDCSPDVFWTHPFLAMSMSLPMVMALGISWQNDVWRHMPPFEPGMKVGPLTLENKTSQILSITFGIIYLTDFQPPSPEFLKRMKKT
jgi:hypothetical protein